MKDKDYIIELQERELLRERNTNQLYRKDLEVLQQESDKFRQNSELCMRKFNEIKEDKEDLIQDLIEEKQEKKSILEDYQRIRQDLARMKQQGKGTVPLSDHTKLEQRLNEIKGQCMVQEGRTRTFSSMYEAQKAEYVMSQKTILNLERTITQQKSQIEQLLSSQHYKLKSYDHY